VIGGIFPDENWQEQKVFDIGCRTGEMVAALVKCGADARGLDICCQSIERARTRFPRLATRFSSGNLLHLKNFKNIKTDKILCFGTFSYLTEKEQFEALLNFSKILNDNGEVIVSLSKNPGRLQRSIITVYQHFLIWKIVDVFAQAIVRFWRRMGRIKPMERDGLAYFYYAYVCGLRHLYPGIPSFFDAFPLINPPQCTFIGDKFSKTYKIKASQLKKIIDSYGGEFADTGGKKN